MRLMHRDRANNITIAQHVAGVLGGRPALTRLTGMSRSWVARWFKARGDRGGFGGDIPRPAQVALIEASMRGECDLLPEDFFPAHDWSATRRRRDL